MHHAKFNNALVIAAACAACMFLIAVAPRDAEARDRTPTRLLAQVATVDGVITEASGETFSLMADDGSTRSFTVNIDTLYTQNGIASTKEKTLKVGNKVSVTHKGDIALTVTGD